tara:strand:- start:14289 stop:15122 length:834 start_codon:yes stop_codon:yes gene_type:complete
MKIYFGDNQFLGVNHSDGKGLTYKQKYKNPEDIASTLRDSWDVGIKDFCFTVDQKTIDAINLIIVDCPFNLHPALPYAHRVNELISQKGLAGALYAKSRKAGFSNLCIASIKSLFGNYDHAFKLLIESEIEGLPLENIKSIGLLNIASDFLLGLKRDDLLKSFYRAVLNGLNKKPLFYTMNFPLMAEYLWGTEYNDCAIVFNYNEKGFRTNPSKNDVKNCIRNYKHNESIAMSIFSGGSAESIKELLLEVPELSGILFGTSKKTNMIKNLQLFSESE